MELKQYATLLWRWAWLIALGTLLTGASAYGISLQTPPVYEASATLLISQARTGNASADYTAVLTGERLAKTYAELLRKRPVLEKVITNLQIDETSEELTERVSVSPIRDTQLLVLRVEDTDSQRAADTANEIVHVFSQQNQEMQAGRYSDTKQSLERELAKVQLDIDRTQASLTALQTPTNGVDEIERERLQTLLAQYRSSYATLLKSLGDVQLAEAQNTNTLSIAETAQAPTDPIRPRTLLNTLLAAIAGLVIAAGVAFLVEYLDDRIKTSEQVAHLTGAMSLGEIGRIAESDLSGKLVTIRDAQSPVAEAYRMLRVNLDFAAIDSSLSAIAVTSSSPEEGKSTTIANLAVAIAQTGKQVILVDTDLRRPTLHKLFDIPNERGVTTALLYPSEKGLSEHLVRPGIRNLQLLPSGPIPPNPAELLGSRRMAELIAALKAEADVVLFDTPPLLVFADAALLARACDGTLLVARASFTRSGALVKVKEQIAQAGAHLLGVVLNRLTTARVGYGSYYYYSQRPPRRLFGLRWPFPRTRKGEASSSQTRTQNMLVSVDAFGFSESSISTIPNEGEYEQVQASGARFSAEHAVSNG